MWNLRNSLVLFLIWMGQCRSVELRALPEFFRPDPFGGIVASDQSGATWLDAVKITAARGSYAAFHLSAKTEGCQACRLSLRFPLPADLYREWFHFNAPDGKYYPDALIPVSAPYQFQIPDGGNHIPGQSSQGFWVDLWIPASAKAQVYRGAAELLSGTERKVIPIELSVLPAIVPAEDAVTLDNLEKYDDGLDTVPKIAAFVAAHNLIVVAADGYIAKDYSGFYGGRPYDVDREGGDLDYGQYFLELVHHIDSTCRTLTSRRYRATSGLSMGGFMSLYLSARYPQLIGSASAFNPGPEFYVGERGRRSLWRPKEHVLNHEKTMVRLIRASGDYISQYHEETRHAYAITPTVDFEYSQNEYHRHWATSIYETFDFHLRAFANPALDALPVEWNYDSGFQKFDAWGYGVETHTEGPAIFHLEHVTQGGLRIRTRRWAPDGPPATCESLDLTTAPLYESDVPYPSVERAVTEGSGNGDGILEPGENATIWIKLKQGIDPFDKNNWRRAKVYTDFRWLPEIADIQEGKGREWTSAQNRTSLVALSSDVPHGIEIPVILDCESWSFDYTPDVRYGKELLYQAFQFHKHHLFAWKWTGLS